MWSLVIQKFFGSYLYYYLPTNVSSIIYNCVILSPLLIIILDLFIKYKLSWWSFHERGVIKLLIIGTYLLIQTLSSSLVYRILANNQNSKENIENDLDPTNLRSNISVSIITNPRSYLALLPILPSEMKTQTFFWRQRLFFAVQLSRGF